MISNIKTSKSNAIVGKRSFASVFGFKICYAIESTKKQSAVICLAYSVFGKFAVNSSVVDRKACYFVIVVAINRNSKQTVVAAYPNVVDTIFGERKKCRGVWKSKTWASGKPT